jgi:hypothetical protein
VKKLSPSGVLIYRRPYCGIIEINEDMEQHMLTKQVFLTENMNM